MILLLLACEAPDDTWFEEAAAIQHARCESRPIWYSDEPWFGMSIFEGYELDLEQGLGRLWWSIRADARTTRVFEETDFYGTYTADLSDGCEVEGLVEVRRVASTVSTAEFALELRTPDIDTSTCPFAGRWTSGQGNETSRRRQDLLHLERDAEDPEVIFLRATSGRHVATGIDHGEVLRFGTANASCFGLGPGPMGPT